MLKFIIKTVTVLVILLMVIIAIVENPCEYENGRPITIRHCDCIGIKVPLPEPGYDMGYEKACVGYVSRRWEVKLKTTIAFQVDPSTSSALVVGAANGRLPDRAPKQFTIKRVGEAREQEYYRPDQVEIRYRYEIHEGKIIFQDKTPIHIEISNPGYKTWKTDIVPETDPIEVKVKLEPEPIPATPKTIEK